MVGKVEHTGQNGVFLEVDQEGWILEVDQGSLESLMAELEENHDLVENTDFDTSLIQIVADLVQEILETNGVDNVLTFLSCLQSWNFVRKSQGSMRWLFTFMMKWNKNASNSVNS